MTSDLDEAIRLLRATERPTTNESEYQLWRTARERLLARHPEPPKFDGCPFCGGMPEMATPKPDSALRHSGLLRAYCHNCQVYGPWGTDEADAVAAWNRRTP